MYFFHMQDISRSLNRPLDIIFKTIPFLSESKILLLKLALLL